MTSRSAVLAGCLLAAAFCLACSPQPEESPRNRVVGRWVFDPEEAIARTEVSIRADEGDFTGGLPAGQKEPEPDELRSHARELAKNLEGAILEIKDDGSFTSVTKWGSGSGTWVLGRNEVGCDEVVMTSNSSEVGKYLVPGEDDLLVSTNFMPVFAYRRAR
jgi:hypothetical protein